jgi:hypothetical protein
VGIGNKANLIVAVNGYKILKKETNANFTDVSAVDNLNKKVLLRIIEPLGSECIVANDVLKLAESIKLGEYDYAFLISRKFTDNAIAQMLKYKIQYASDNYMPPFDIEKLYLAIVDCANSQCQRKCGKVPLAISDCLKKKATDGCKTRAVADSAKCHFEQGLVGLLKNDLMMTLALSK